MSLSAKEKFQTLLRDLFQFDCADLDFGIYRIMNHKRAVIERFITENLPKAIAEELARDAFAKQGRAQEALNAARKELVNNLGEATIEVNGNLAEQYRETPLGRKYLEAQAQAKGPHSTEALDALFKERMFVNVER
ncbi:MAG: hypothetical protein N2316_11765 [Spirochaetes bacterium]|nr:hypothetical protein [Spirochaetota bacterium]